jgi:hypothetical protein
MRWILMLPFLAALALTPLQRTEAAVNIGVSIGEEGLRGFYLAVGDYFRVPEREVIIIQERRIPDDEIPVVFFLAARARVSPGVIVDLRLGGKSWLDITLHLRLGPEIYYVPIPVAVKGPPYGKAYGYYKNKPKKDWGKIVLADADVVNLVNLRFVSEHYHYAPEKVIEMRSKGKNFVVINDQVKKEKGKGGGNKDKGQKEKENGGGKGQGKGKGKK